MATTPGAAALAASLERVRARIAAAERLQGRTPGSVRLLAVSKTFGAEAVAAAAALGQLAFGENYVQEAVAKIAALAARPAAPVLEWHFIGPIQSNKTRPIAEHFDWVQSIDRLAIAQRLSAQRPPGRPPLQALVEVNISAEASKSGAAPAQATDLARAVRSLPGLRLRGIMSIPRPGQDAVAQRAEFAALRGLFAALRGEFGPDIDTLSMGMSGDFEMAIAEGSTMVRVGTAIFGERT